MGRAKDPLCCGETDMKFVFSYLYQLARADILPLTLS
jgi:hypothetical protein